MSEEKKIFTLTQLNTSLERFINEKFQNVNYWVIAEIARVNEKRGHRYIELADSDGEGKLSAKMSASMWKSNYEVVLALVGRDLERILQPGNKALFQIRIEFHSIYGMKLNILDIDPNYSYGEIERKKQETIKRLKEEGHFYKQSEIYLPTIVKRIAIIGSKGTSGHKDFINEISTNAIFTRFKIKEFQSSVQGENAPKELAQALREARLYNVDVIVIIRGGGSQMDLNCFNDYELCKEICLTKIPVLTGIGHETDEVVADLVARQKAITPSAIAQHIYLQIGMFLATVNDSFHRVINLTNLQMSETKETFQHLSNYLVHYSQQLLTENKQILAEESHHLQVGFYKIINTQKSDLELVLNKISNLSSNKIQMANDVELSAVMDRIGMSALNLMKHSSIEIDNLEELLRLLNPEELLRKGYTISTVEGKDVYTLENVEGKTLKTLTDKSIITSTIINIENQDYGEK